MKLRLVVPVAIALIAAAQPAFAERIAGRVVGVADGDTLTVLTGEKRQVRVRLAGVDAPERRQPYGTRARQALSALAFGRSALVAVEDTDRYGRSVGRVRVGGRDVNAEMVRRGAAWVYTRHNRDPSLVPPWEWRAARRTERERGRAR